jgi:hypothetical protein
VCMVKRVSYGMTRLTEWAVLTCEGAELFPTKDRDFAFRDISQASSQAYDTRLTIHTLFAQRSYNVLPNRDPLLGKVPRPRKSEQPIL